MLLYLAAKCIGVMKLDAFWHAIIPITMVSPQTSAASDIDPGLSVLTGVASRHARPIGTWPEAKGRWIKGIIPDTLKHLLCVFVVRRSMIKVDHGLSTFHSFHKNIGRTRVLFILRDSGLSAAKACQGNDEIHE